jgi:hypothetical protein
MDDLSVRESAGDNWGAPRATASTCFAAERRVSNPTREKISLHPSSSIG